MPSTLSPAAKTKVAALAAVVMAGVTAWQIASRDGFTWWDLIPVVAAVAGVATTDHVENTVRSPVAKTVVHGALSAVAAVAAGLAAVVGPEPSGVSVAKLAVAVLGSLAVWYMPESAPAVKVIEGELAGDKPITAVLATVAADVSASMGPDLPANAPTTVTTALAAPPSEPTPIADATASALTDTAPLPAVTA